MNHYSPQASEKTSAKSQASAKNDPAKALKEERQKAAALGQEVKRQQQEIKKLQQRIADLEAEAQQKRPASSVGGVSLSIRERENWPGELKSMVILALQASLSGLPKDSRREHVVKDVLKHNENCLDELHRRQEKIKTAFKSYSRIDERIKEVFRDNSITYDADGKHYRAICYGDPRYHITFAKTPSDSQRAGLNIATEFCKKLY